MPARQSRQDDSRRRFLLAASAAGSCGIGAAASTAPVIDTHVHVWTMDTEWILGRNALQIWKWTK